jgi:hypothetical protein
MQEQRFEKQVQEKMEDLSLRPSAPVWQKVESEIRRKKEKRRVIIWALPLVLLCGTAVWWFNSPSIGTHSNKVADVTTNSYSKERKLQENTDLPVSSETNDIKLMTDRGTKAPTNKFNADLIERTKQNIEQAKRRLAYKAYNKNASTQFQQRITKNKNNVALYTPVPEENNYNAIAGNKRELTPDTKSILFNDSKLTLKSTDTIANKENPQITEETSAADIIQTKKRAEKNNKWSWKLQGSYGSSTVKTGLIEGQTRALGNTFASPMVVGNGISYPPASKPQNAGSFSIGIHANKTLNSRFSLFTGLQYTYFSTNILVGETMSRNAAFQANFTQASSRYIGTGQSRTYKNKYHFIDIPFGLDWKPLKRIPLQMQTGITVSRLVNTDALLYDQSTGVYYLDKDAIEKSQIHLFSNLSYQIWKNKKLNLYAGPYMRYGLTGLEKGNMSKEGHLLSGGITTYISIK